MATTTAKKPVTKAVKAAPKAKATDTPLSDSRKKRLKELNIVAETEEEAKEKLMVIFTREEVFDMEGDPLDDLIDMALAFPEKKDEKEKEEKISDSYEVDLEGEDAEADAASNEEEEEEEAVMVAKPAKKVKVTAADKSAKFSAKAKAAMVVETEEEAEEAEEEVEEDALVEEVETKKLVNKVKKTPIPVGRPEKKTTKAAKAPRIHKLQGKRWATLTDEERNKALKPFRKILNEKQFRINFLNDSFIVKHVGDASEQNIFKYHLLRLQDNGKFDGVFISHRFKTPDELQEYLPDDLEGLKLLKGESCSYVHPFSQDQVIDILTTTDFLTKSVALATKQDTKMKESRKKLEAQLNEVKTPAKAVAVAPKKVVAADPRKVVASSVVKKVETRAAPVKAVPAKKATPVKKK